MYCCCVLLASHRQCRARPAIFCSTASAMAAAPTWAEWLAGLWNSLRAPAACSPEAQLEETRVGALLDKERAKPPGQRDEERVRQLEIEHCKLMLRNLQVRQRRRRWPRVEGAVPRARGWH